jgi:hypothetical protein
MTSLFYKLATGGVRSFQPSKTDQAIAEAVGKFDPNIRQLFGPFIKGAAQVKLADKNLENVVATVSKRTGMSTDETRVLIEDFMEQIRTNGFGKRAKKSARIHRKSIKTVKKSTKLKLKKSMRRNEKK